VFTPNLLWQSFIAVVWMPTLHQHRRAGSVQTFRQEKRVGTSASKELVFNGSPVTIAWSDIRIPSRFGGVWANILSSGGQVTGCWGFSRKLTASSIKGTSRNLILLCRTTNRRRRCALMNTAINPGLLQRRNLWNRLATVIFPRMILIHRICWSQ
jgi:hypothetical protein